MKMGRALGAFVVACGLMAPSAMPLPASARCAMQLLVLRILTPSTASLPRDGGGIVIGVENSPEGTPRPLPGRALLTRGRRSQELVARTLAPGLVRLSGASRLTTGTFTTDVVGAPTSLTIGRQAMPGIPTRPSVTAVRRVGVAAGLGTAGGERTRSEVRATLEFPVPEGIVAVIAYWGESSTPAGWQRAIQGQTEIVIWSEPMRCQLPIDGVIAPSDGASARIAYVDLFGQVSPVSSPVAIQ